MDSGIGLLDGFGGQDEDVLTQAVRAMRSHLDMDIGVLSEFSGDRYVLRALDAPGLGDAYKVGDAFPLDINYCPHVVAGDLPPIIGEVNDFPLARSLPITDLIGIRAYVGLPVRREDGSVYGMFCCVSHESKPGLNERDLKTVRLFADLSAREVQRRLREAGEIEVVNQRIDAALSPGGFSVHVQPILSLAQRRMTGLEALCRFQVPPQRGPDIWFAEAASVSRQTELEHAVLERALDLLDRIPAHLTLSLNASPETVMQGELANLMARRSPERLILEVTEHAQIPDYAALNREMMRLRSKGVRLAVDDAGAGYAGLRHILQLRPDIIKLDMSLVRDIDTDGARRSLTVALCHYANETGAALIAEGIETTGELEMLTSLGVGFGQGYLLGRPSPVEEVFPAGGVTAAAQIR